MSQKHLSAEPASLLHSVLQPSVPELYLLPLASASIVPEPKIIPELLPVVQLLLPLSLSLPVLQGVQLLHVLLAIVESYALVPVLAPHFGPPVLSI